MKNDPKDWPEQPHDYKLCPDCQFSPVDHYGLCLLSEGWRDTGLDNDYPDPCGFIKALRNDQVRREA